MTYLLAALIENEITIQILQHYLCILTLLVWKSFNKLLLITINTLPFTASCTVLKSKASLQTAVLCGDTLYVNKTDRIKEDKECVIHLSFRTSTEKTQHLLSYLNNIEKFNS